MKFKKTSIGGCEVIVFEDGSIFRRISRHNPDKNTYTQISINGEKKSGHRVVAETFIPNPDNKPFVNHKNGIKWDNRKKNLEWSTEQENSIHSYAVLKRPVSGAAANPQGKWRSIPVIQLSLDGKKIKDWDRIIDAANYLKISDKAIIHALKGDHFSAGGYMWQYKNKENIKSKRVARKKTPVVCITTNTNYESIYLASKKTGLSQGSIWRSLKGNKEVKGLHFSYLKKAS